MNRRELLLAAAAVAVAPRQALAAAGAAPLVLVTADLESSVLAVDPASGDVRRRISTLAFPRSIETVGRTAVVAHSDVGAVSLIDATALFVSHVLRGFGEPRYTAAHPDGRHAFVTDADRGEVVAIDVLRGRVVGREQVGPHARHVTVDPAGRTLWIALGSKAAEVAIVDVSAPARPRLVRRFRPPFLAHDVGIAPDGRHLWVSSGDRQELVVYDRRDGRLLLAAVRRLASPARHVRRRDRLRDQRLERHPPSAPRRRPAAPPGAGRGRLVQRPAGTRARGHSGARARHADGSRRTGQGDPPQTRRPLVARRLSGQQHHPRRRGNARPPNCSVTFE